MGGQFFKDKLHFKSHDFEIITNQTLYLKFEIKP